MKRNVVFLVGLCFIMGSCKDSSVAPRSNTPLTLNGSFEIGGMPTLEGWRVGNPQLAQLVPQAPPNGGNWSLELTSDWAPTSGFAYAPLTDLKSGDVVRLSAYIRAAGPYGGGGILQLVVGPQHYSSHRKFNSSTDTLWQQISVTDTLALSPGDTVWVVLSSLHTELVPFRGLFDLVTYERIENRRSLSHSSEFDDE
jgi:hypothetical protein